jgi:ubiquinone/menaquinone biosynthesis C-methylase UbiE
MDAPLREYALDASYRRAYLESLAPTEASDPYAIARFDEGRRWRHVTEELGVPEGPALDVASGSGGATLALAASGRFVVSVDMAWSETARHARRQAGGSYRRAAANAEQLPIIDRSCALVLCLDAIEHFVNPDRAASEIARILKTGGCVIVTTSPRLPYLFRRDPHFNIRFLFMFPASVQRRMAARRGFTEPHHYVGRIFTSAQSIERLFTGCRIERILNRTRFPDRWFFDAVVLRKYS